MKTTLNQIREHSPCTSGWEKLLSALKKTKADDEELNLLTILDSNGIEDAIWCFRAVEGYDDTISAFSRFCAVQNIEKIKPYTSEYNYALIIEWLTNGDAELRSAAETAAWSAAETAAETAAWTAAETAAWSAARSAAWTAAWSAARSAAWTAAETAARSAAETAAWTAARSAAWTAARSAAWTAAETAARSDQATELRRILMELE